VLDAEVGEAQRGDAPAQEVGVLDAVPLHRGSGEVIGAAVELDREVVLGPEAVDLPVVEVDVALRLGDLGVLREQAVKGALQL
jgi:hypothetical protein